MKLPESIRRRLEEYCGLDSELISNTSLALILKYRKAECNIFSDEEYFKYLLSTQIEFDHFVESLLIPETWFFRDTNPFIYLKSFSEKFNKNKTILRILSIPCATGEETYSIAMALLEQGWSIEKLSIYGIDISYNFLDIARKGIYTHKSFRSQDFFDKSKYFDKIDTNHFIVKEYIRNAIQFIPGNIVDPYLFNEAPPFHIIFARNVLIYFSINARKKVLKNIDRLLRPDGCLFLGHADNITFLSKKFKLSNNISAFAFEKKLPKKNNIKIIQECQKQTKNEIKQSPLKYDHQFKNHGTQFLEKVRELADKGLLNEAEKYNNKYIELYGHSAESYFLMGQIYAAQDKLDLAEEAYKKSIYLDNNYSNAIFHLELLSIKKGDREQAKILRDRIIRLNNNLN